MSGGFPDAIVTIIAEAPTRQAYGNTGMAVAAVTPRVRTIAICDDVIASLTEEGVFTLEGVRQRQTAAVFPWRSSLNVFLLLSSARKGRYSGKILVVSDQTDRRVRYVKFVARIHEDNEILPLQVEIGDCEFPEAGRYDFEVYFTGPNGGEALKGEHPFEVTLREE
jgi:hypothetical protein